MQNKHQIPPPIFVGCPKEVAQLSNISMPGFASLRKSSVVLVLIHYKKELANYLHLPTVHPTHRPTYKSTYQLPWQSHLLSFSSFFRTKLSLVCGLWDSLPDICKSRPVLMTVQIYQLFSVTLLQRNLPRSSSRPNNQRQR